MSFQLRLLLPAALCCCALSHGQEATDLTTFVEPLPGEEILQACEYRLAPLAVNGAVRAAWVIFDRGQDYLQWFHDRRVRAFANQHRLALILAMHCRSKEREDMIVEPSKGVGRALFTALKQFAASTARPEFASVGIVPMGWSGAGSLVGRLAGYAPERYVAGIAYAPGQYDPLGMDTIELSDEAIKSPQLIVANGGDAVNGTERPYQYFRKYFDKGAPWTFVIQNRLPHCCLQNAQNLILEWLHSVLGAENSLGTGDHAYLTIQPAEVLDTWKRPTFNATAGRIGPKGRARRDERPAGWMPSPSFSQEWLTLVGKPNPIAIWKP
jgi:dienelactone hydrolase